MKVKFLFPVVLFLALLQAPPALAGGTWYVSTTGSDTNDCLSPSTPCATINGALGKQGFVPGDLVKVAIGTFTGAGDQVVLIDKGALVSGGWNADFTEQSGLSTVDGQKARGGITVNSPGAVAIDHFDTRNGSASYGAGIYNWSILTIDDTSVSGGDAYAGGGINNLGTLTVRNSIVAGNSGSEGGGILNGEVLTVVNSTIADNDANNGGGIDNLGTGLTISRSTISGNSARSNGGGIWTDYRTATITGSTISGNSAIAGGGIKTRETQLTISNSTISGNTAGAGGGLEDRHGLTIISGSTISGNSAQQGGDIDGYYSSVTAQNTIIANSPSGGNCNLPGNPLISYGYNLSSDDTCQLGSIGDLNNTDPKLGPLQNNGGSTWTHALLTGSPAINAGNPAHPTGQGEACLTRDQRGALRTAKSDRCDMGAYEYP